MSSQPARRLEVEVLAQPDGTTCGPTCLQAVYRYWGDDVALAEVISDVAPLPGGGTLAVSLACAAMRRGYRATIYTYDLHVFDPTWFVRGVDIAAKLRRQLEVKHDPKLAHATAAYLELLALGGKLRYEELRPSLLRRHLRRREPILTGLSATYLYSCARERDDKADDIGGEPMGHFVVLSGYDADARNVHVADPLQDNPGFGTQSYTVGINRLLGAILLGTWTYDANLLVLTPRAPRAPRKRS